MDTVFQHSLSLCEGRARFCQGLSGREFVASQKRWGFSAFAFRQARSQLHTVLQHLSYFSDGFETEHCNERRSRSSANFGLNFSLVVHKQADVERHIATVGGNSTAVECKACKISSVHSRRGGQHNWFLCGYTDNFAKKREIEIQDSMSMQSPKLRRLIFASLTLKN